MSKGYPTFAAAVEGSLRHVEALQGFEVVAEYRYSYDDIVVRFERYGDGKRIGKEIRPFHRGDDGRWRSCKSDQPYPLYGEADIPETGMLLYLEGEKCQGIAAELGFPAVTCAYSKPKLTDQGKLAGRDVAIVKDAGEAGQVFANKLAEILLALSPPARVRIIELPGLADKEDLEEFVEQHGPARAREMIDDLIKTTECIASAKATLETPRPRCATDRDAPRFANYHLEQVVEGAKTSYVNVPHGMHEISEDLAKLAPGWPKRVGESLFVASGDFEPVYLGSSTRLFAWIDQQAQVDWTKGSRHVTQERFYEHLRMTVEQYDTVEVMPHTPPMAGHYYMHPTLPRASGHLDKLVDLFTPATDVDRELIKTAIVTPSWGGSAGSRPGFLITGEDADPEQGRGLGKTTLVDLIADEVYRGSISVSPTEDIGTVKTRLLSPEGAPIRIARLDNVKTLRFSWADLEDLMCSTVISGRALYQGEGRRPNTFVWFITLNGPSLSKDMAQRVIPVKLKRPTFSASWRDDTRKFIRSNRWEILADIADLLSRRPGTLKPLTRWAAWESGVLSKVDRAEECQRTIIDRQGVIDEDNSDRDLIRDYICKQISGVGGDPDTSLFQIPSALMAEWVSTATRTNYQTNRATTFVKGLSIAELTPARDKHFRGWIWCGSNSTEREPTRFPSPQQPPRQPHFSVDRPY